MAARKSPELHADGHLDGREREILLLLSRLKLHQNLMELPKMRKILIMSNMQKAYFIIIYNKTEQPNIIGKLIYITVVC